MKVRVPRCPCVVSLLTWRQAMGWDTWLPGSYGKFTKVLRCPVKFLPDPDRNKVQVMSHV